jgi:hypothetical protein
MQNVRLTRSARTFRREILNTLVVAGPESGAFNCPRSHLHPPRPDDRMILFQLMPRNQDFDELSPGRGHLLARLDPIPEQAQDEYIRLYQRLLRFFEWRGCHHPEEAADSTLDRVEIKLEKGANVPNVQAFVTGVARLVCLEYLRAQDRFVPLPVNAEIESHQSCADEDEGALACLEQCLTKLQPESRKLIRGYL